MGCASILSLKSSRGAIKGGGTTTSHNEGLGIELLNRSGVWLPRSLDTSHPCHPQTTQAPLGPTPRVRLYSTLLAAIVLLSHED